MFSSRVIYFQVECGLFDGEALFFDGFDEFLALVDLDRDIASLGSEYILMNNLRFVLGNSGSGFWVHVCNGLAINLP